jgi:uncharacterized protein YkwD
MKQITVRARAAALAAVLAFLGGCGGSFGDPGLPDTGGTVRDALATADGEVTRTAGLAFDREAPYTEWPPRHPIEISFPASMNTPGLNGLAGEGTVKETKWSQLEKDIVWEVNKFRADPVGWCNANGLPMLDGIPAQAEFIQNVNRRPYAFPAQPVYPSAGLHKAALHQAARGSFAHSDVSRVKAYAGFSAWGENLCYAAGFIRDSGVSGKGHRINIANPVYDRVGIGCYNGLVLMQFGSGITEKNP